MDGNKILRQSTYIPDRVPAVIPSSFLCQHLEMLDEVWSFNTETDCRAKIDEVLAAAVRSPGKTLHVFCEVKNDWRGSGFSYTGCVDYMIGSGCTMGNSEVDSCLVSVEATKEWPESGVAQILAEMGCLQKNRLSKGKKTPVFGMLSNGLMFQFFAIGINSSVYGSGMPIVLSPDPVNGKYESSESLANILRWLKWFCDTMKTVFYGARLRCFRKAV